jgi:hypothetical protein
MKIAHGFNRGTGSQKEKKPRRGGRSGVNVRSVVPPGQSEIALHEDHRTHLKAHTSLREDQTYGAAERSRPLWRGPFSTAPMKLRRTSQ